MFPLQFTRLKYLAVGLGSSAILVFAAMPLVGVSQDKKDVAPAKVDPALDHAKHSHPADSSQDKTKSDAAKPEAATSDTNKEVLEQLKLLQAKVVKLEASVAKIAPLQPT